MRIFFALDLEPATKMAVADWRDNSFRNLAAKDLARAVPAANFHITLAFVGEVSDNKLERLCADVDLALERKPLKASDFTIDELGYWQRPGILWLGMKHPPSPLLALASTLQGLSSQIGGKGESNKYQPHVTLFRNCQLAPQAPLLAPEFSSRYSEFVLMESRQGKRGVSYHALHYWQLPANK